MELFRGVPWVSLASLAPSSMPPGHGDYGAVYGFRLADTKELLYIGSTSRLRRRLLGNYLGGIGGETTQRIHRLLFTDFLIDRVEVAWQGTGAGCQMEREFLADYRREHGNLPRWNLNQPGEKSRRLLNVATCLECGKLPNTCMC